MKDIKLDIKIDLSGTEKQLMARRDLAQKRLAAAVLADSAKFIPKDTGNLERSGVIASTGKIVMWATSYALAVWQMPAAWIKLSRNPNARPKWFEHAKALQINNWKRLVKDTMSGKV